MSQYPALRLRRTRASEWSRRLHAETVLTPANLIWPLFVTEGAAEEPIASLPGVSRWGVKDIVARAREARDLGIPCLALFPNTPRELRTDDGREALNPDNLMCRAIRAIKDAVPDIGVLTDVALDPIPRTAMTASSMPRAMSSTTRPARCWSTRRCSRPRRARTSSPRRT